MAEYLWEPNDLYKVAFADLGPIDTGTYVEFESRARKIAEEKGISKPLMIIDIKFKQGAHPFLNEYCHPIADFEWNQFVSDAKTMCTSMPRAYVVDGNKYTAPI